MTGRHRAPFAPFVVRARHAVARSARGGLLQALAQGIVLAGAVLVIALAIALPVVIAACGGPVCR